MKNQENILRMNWKKYATIPIIGLLTFGILNQELGFFWDDWSKTLVNILYGFEGYKPYYAFDRPLSGWTHIIFVNLIGNNRILWQFLGLFLRVMASFGMNWAFSKLWPDRKNEILLASILYFLYPSFTQQPIAVTYHQQLLQACFYFLSLGNIFLSIKNPDRYWLFTSFALIANAIQFTITEYFLGLVLVIPLFIVIQLSGIGFKGKRLWTLGLQKALPHICLVVIYAIWRFNYIYQGGEDPHALVTIAKLIQTPFQTLINQVIIITFDIFQFLIASWAPVFGLAIDKGPLPIVIFSWFISLLISLLLIMMLKNVYKNEDTDHGDKWIVQFIVMGAIVVIFGMTPAWVTGRSLLDDYHANRFSLPGMYGAAFIVVALISWFIRSWQKKIIFLSVLAGLAGGYQVRIVNDYRWNWSNQTNLYWQLFWRAPSLQSNTAIFFEEEPIPNQGLFSLSSAINLIYLHDPIEGKLPYWAFTILPRYASATEFPGAKGLEPNFRSLGFSGNTDASIILHNDGKHGNCWWILTQEDLENPYISSIEKEWASNSKLERILIPEIIERPDIDLFGPEPPVNWCYLFQKAELASQYEQWDYVVKLADQAKQMGFQPAEEGANSPREWLPFIKGYINSNQAEEAAYLTLQSYKLDPKYQPMLCTLWETAGKKNISVDEWKKDIDANLSCNM